MINLGNRFQSHGAYSDFDFDLHPGRLTAGSPTNHP